jgi:hypothetical protein
VTSTLQDHLARGLRHLLTEDVVRFATIRALVDAGISPERLRVEHRIADLGSIDLVVDLPPTAMLELKYPRDPQQQSAADTMTLGELLRDLYRLAWVDLEDSFAVQVIEPRLRRFLSRRRELDWTTAPGQAIDLPNGLAAALPLTAQRCLPVWSQGLAVTATCTYSARAGDLTVAVYRVARPELHQERS